MTWNTNRQPANNTLHNSPKDTDIALLQELRVCEGRQAAGEGWFYSMGRRTEGGTQESR